MCSAWKQTKADYCLLNGETVKSYIPYLSAGVVTKEHTDAARLFVKSLLGKEAETANINESTGFPVNRAAFDAISQEKMDDPNVKKGISIAFGDEDNMYGYEYQNLTQKEVERLTEMVESLTEPSMTNRVIQEIVLEQGDKYLLGEQELEHTVEAVLQREYKKAKELAENVKKSAIESVGLDYWKKSKGLFCCAILFLVAAIGFGFRYS